MVQAGGLEPPTIRLSDGTSNQLKYACIRRAENYSPPSGVLCQVLVSTMKKLIKYGAPAESRTPDTVIF